MIKENLNEKNDLPAIDVEKVLSVGKVVSTEEVIKEITPVSWNQDVLNGDYVGKTIIKNCDSINNTSIEEKANQKVYKR